MCLRIPSLPRFVLSHPTRDVQQYIEELDEGEEFGVGEVMQNCPFGPKKANLRQVLAMEARQPDAIFARYFARNSL